MNSTARITTAAVGSVISAAAYLYIASFPVMFAIGFVIGRIGRIFFTATEWAAVITSAGFTYSAIIINLSIAIAVMVYSFKKIRGAK